MSHLKNNVIAALITISYAANVDAMLSSCFTTKIVGPAKICPNLPKKFCSLKNTKEQIFDRFERLSRYNKSDSDERGSRNYYGMNLLDGYLKIADDVIRCGGMKGTCCRLPELEESKRQCLSNSYLRELTLYEYGDTSLIKEFTINDFHKQLVAWIEANTAPKMPREKMRQEYVCPLTDVGKR